MREFYFQTCSSWRFQLYPSVLYRAIKCVCICFSNSEFPVNVSLWELGEGVSHTHKHVHTCTQTWAVRQRGSDGEGSWRNILHTGDKERYNSPTCVVKPQPSRLMFSDRACKVSSQPKRLLIHTHTDYEWVHTCYIPTGAHSCEREHSEMQLQARTKRSQWKVASLIRPLSCWSHLKINLIWLRCFNLVFNSQKQSKWLTQEKFYAMCHNHSICDLWICSSVHLHFITMISKLKSVVKLVCSKDKQKRFTTKQSQSTVTTWNLMLKPQSLWKKIDFHWNVGHKR